MSKRPTDYDKELLQLPLRSPSPLSDYSIGDRRAEFAKLSRKSRRNPAAEQAFLASKLHVLRTHPSLSLVERKNAVEIFTSRFVGRRKAPSGTQPVPGGVGYGMFYDSAFKANFTTGTAIAWDIVCPTPPGGGTFPPTYT